MASAEPPTGYVVTNTCNRVQQKGNPPGCPQEQSGDCGNTAPEERLGHCPGAGCPEEEGWRGRKATIVSPPSLERAAAKSPREEGGPLPPIHLQRYSEGGTRGEAPTTLLPSATTEDEGPLPKRRKRQRPRKRERRRRARLISLPRRELRQIRAHSSLRGLQSRIAVDSGKFNIINLSRRTLSTPEMRVLGKGLSFIPKPKRILKERLLAEFGQFARKMRLKYIFRDAPMKESKFRRKSAYRPDPTDNQTLESVIQEIEERLSSLPYEQLGGPSNLTRAERDALDTLAEDNTIVINKADKANVVVVQNHDDYAREGLNHLSDTTVYLKLPHDTTMEVDLLVTNFVERWYREGLLSREMADFCLPGKSVRTARIYFLKKTHKNPMGIRPIVSGIKSPTEQLSECVDIWLQPHMCQLPSYVKDSTAFINILEGLTFQPDCLLASIDVTSLYTNIVHKEGIECSVSALQQSYGVDPDQPPPEVIGEMINIILTNNVFEFEGQYYLQLQGCAMGTKCAPAYASIFMGHVERTLQAMAGDKVLLWRRFIDDIFLIYGGNREEFDRYMVDINGIHPTIKFTSECSPDQVTFLDTTVYKGERFRQSGVLDVKTYVKTTNKQLYVHATSYHPRGTGKGIIIGEALRYLRTNSDEQNFHQSIAKHKQVLRNRGYNPTVTNKLLEPITFDERQTTLIPKAVDESRRANPPLTFVTTYNDAVPQVRKVIYDLWPRLHADGNLKLLFPDAPILALKRNRTVANRVVKSKPIPIFGATQPTSTLRARESATTPGEAPVYETAVKASGEKDARDGVHPVEPDQTRPERDNTLVSELGGDNAVDGGVLMVSREETETQLTLPRDCKGTSGWVDPTRYQPRLSHIPLPFLTDPDQKTAGVKIQGERELTINQPQTNPEPKLSPEGERSGIDHPKLKLKSGGVSVGLNQPKLMLNSGDGMFGSNQPKLMLKSGEVCVGPNQPKLMLNSGDGVFGSNQPKLMLKSGEVGVGSNQPKLMLNSGDGAFGSNQPKLMLKSGEVGVGSNQPKLMLNSGDGMFGSNQPKLTLKSGGVSVGVNQPTLTLNTGEEMFGANPPKLTPLPSHGAMGIKISQPEHSPDDEMFGRTPPQRMPNSDHNTDQTHGDQQPCCSKDTPSIIRALPRPPRTEAGIVVKCGNPGCILCPILTTETTVRSRLSKRKHRICGDFTCHTQRLVYLLECARCHKQYVGQTINSLAQRAGRHLSVISQKGCMKLQLHFKGDGHTPRDVRFQPLAKISDELSPSEAETQLKSTETMWIKRLGTMQPVGLNYILEDREQRVTQQ